MSKLISSDAIRFDLQLGTFVQVVENHPVFEGQVSLAFAKQHPERFLTAADLAKRLAKEKPTFTLSAYQATVDGPPLSAELVKIAHLGYAAVYQKDCSLEDFLARGLLSWKRMAEFFEMPPGRAAMDQALHKLQNSKTSLMGRSFSMLNGPALNWDLAEAIYAGYSALYGTKQSLEKLAQRGGFAWEEVVEIYADERGRRAIDTELRKKGILL